MTKMRINRAIAQSGICSRRAADELIFAGQVSVNDQAVREPGMTVDIRKDRIKVRGQQLRFSQRHHYYIYYKPRGVVSTLNDERGRESLAELCASLPGQPRPVGRLDRSSEGLLLLCTDGELANRMTHPRYGVSKEYRVTVQPRLSNADARKMLDGVMLEDGRAWFDAVELVSLERDRSRLNVVISEGRNRLIRRVCEALGYQVRRLKRTRFGSLALEKMAVGEYRELTASEIRNLKNSLKLD